MATNLKQFLKANKKKKEVVEYPVTASLCDDDGNPLMWKIRPITTKESEDIRERHTTEVPVKGKPGLYRNKFDSSAFVRDLLCQSVVEPNLYNAELQNSYGVKTPEELLVELVDDPSEYNNFASFVQNLGSDSSFNDKVEEAKN